MFSHVMVGSNDIALSKAFYDAALGALGIPAGTEDASGRVMWMTPGGMFAVTRPLDDGAAHGANGGTIGFKASSSIAVDAWHAAGLAHGGTVCEAPPGPRASDFGSMYVAYLRDPAGNKICALHAAGV